MKKWILLLYLISPLLYATAQPLLTFEPLTPTSISLASNQTATVQYRVTNMSQKPHTWVMRPINGITQITTQGNCPNPFILSAKQSCIFTLQVNGNQIAAPITDGPVVCQQSVNRSPNPLLCYRPSSANSLYITQGTLQLPTLYSGAQNGNVYYSSNNGSWTATTPPANGSAINSIVATNTTLYAGAANGTVYASFNRGTTWSPITTPAPGFAVNGLYVANQLYIASTNGQIFICTLNGTNCSATTAPTGSAVNGVFATTNALYAATQDGTVAYSADNGLSWTIINNLPDGSAVKAVYVANNTLFVNTENQYVYTSTALTGGGVWSLYAQTVFSLFVNGATILAGTQGGFVYSLSTGNSLGFVAYTAINSVYLLE